LAFRERITAGFLRLLGIFSVKTRIIVFAAIATLIPSITMGWLSYIHNKRFLSETITQELQSVTSHASREIDLWLKGKIYDVRVFSGSYVISENLEKLGRSRSSQREKKIAVSRIGDYLKSVKAKFIDYEELLVCDMKGDIVASSSTKKTMPNLPKGWERYAAKGNLIIGSPQWDESLQSGITVLAVPIVSVGERVLGVLVSKLNFITVNKILGNYPIKETGELYLVTLKGAVLAGTRKVSSGFMKIGMEMVLANRLFSNEAAVLNYENYRGLEVVGTLRKIAQVGWGVVAERERSKAYSEIYRLRNITIGFTVGTLLVIGIGAYLLGLTIVIPLNRLIQGANRVGSGDLDIDLPVLSRDELGFMTKVFNNMVGQLRRGREELAAINRTLEEKNAELQELSIRDSLTGLYNRKHLTETLINEIARSKRHKNTFGVLMIDIDHFKKYNDEYGHLAGDEVLRKMADIFKGSIRECDYTARYGGEEFLIMMPETDSDSTLKAAERIRGVIEKEQFNLKDETLRLTISIGVALYPQNGSDPDSLIDAADTSLYQAKKAGRNRVVLAEKASGKEKGKAAKKK